MCAARARAGFPPAGRPGEPDCQREKKVYRLLVSSASSAAASGRLTADHFAGECVDVVKKSPALVSFLLTNLLRFLTRATVVKERYGL